ncbi:hypothetical protein [Streptomyces sp. NPDC101455]|uniref:hypothetical protein n=1 Tax=Streptomyces sp. NPDC101455 TaxID=3366142 RepID=UPI00381F1A9A
MKSLDYVLAPAPAMPSIFEDLVKPDGRIHLRFPNFPFELADVSAGEHTASREPLAIANPPGLHRS